jgi:hypothetical protein
LDLIVDVDCFDVWDLIINGFHLLELDSYIRVEIMKTEILVTVGLLLFQAGAVAVPLLENGIQLRQRGAPLTSPHLFEVIH